MRFYNTISIMGGFIASIFERRSFLSSNVRLIVNVLPSLIHTMTNLFKVVIQKGF